MKLIREDIENIKVLEESRNGKKQLYIEGIFLQGDVRNRNNRVYPFSILEKEVTRYMKEYVKEGRALGELGHPCHNFSTELLTIDGWKYIKDCKENELVYTFNPETENLELKSVKKTIKYKHKGKAYHIHGRSIDTVVTGDHKFVLKDRYGSYEFFTTNKIYQNFNKLSHHSIPKASNGLQLISPEYFVIPAIYDGLFLERFINKYNKDLHIDFKIFSQFLGIYLSEGYCSKNKKNNFYKIGISQNEGEKADEIREILKNLGVNWHEKSITRDTGIPHIHFTCYDRRLGKYLSQFGDAYSKYIDPVFIKACNAETARLFLDAFVLGDGRGEISKKNNRCDYFSVSEKLIDDISQLAIIAGIACRKYSEITKKDYIFADRIIKKENKSTLYFCRFLNTKGIYTDSRFLKIDEIDFDDYVYCIEVENHTFIARDKGFTFVSGNCSPSINLDRVSHKIVSLRAEGKNFVGKAKILESTPMGGIAKSLLSEGVKLGVSSRALGSLIPHREGFNVVGEDLILSTAADIVADPSAPDAFVNGLMEGKEWVYNPHIKEWIVEDIKKDINNLYKNNQVNENTLLEQFNRYINTL